MPLGHSIALIINAHPARQRKRSSVQANGSIARTLNRKTSLLRIVPTLCGQAADIAADMTPPRRRFIAVPRDHVAMLGDCASVATLRHGRFSERSYLFTMSNITPAHQASRPHGAGERRSLRTSRDSAGGARRNRTDDLLLAKQALSQLSYGPSRYTEASIRGRTCAPDHRYLIPESGGPGKI